MKHLLHLIAGTACLLPFLFSSCGGDSTDDPAPDADYLKISPATAFTFDEGDLSKNTFTVSANADLSWQAAASPSSGVHFDRALGSGNGNFSLTDMPAGTTIEVYAKHSYSDGRPSLESNRVKVTRAKAAVTLTVSPPKLTYDESDAAKNSVEVRSNTTWRASSPNGEVTFSPDEGSGDGTVRITAAPVGESTLTVVTGDGEETLVRTVTITRSVALTIAPDNLTFNESDAAKNSVEIRSNTAWNVSSTAEGMTFSPASGTGDGTVRITAAPNGTSTLTVTAGEGAKAVTRTLTVTRNVSPTPVDPIFRLDFGTGSTIWASESDDWKTHTGTGAAQVTYNNGNVRIYSDNYGSAGRYEGASGGRYARLFYNVSTDFFEVQHIALPAGKTDFQLTFGTICRTDDLSVQLSADGRRWVEVAYTAAPAYNTWTLAVCDFSLTQPVSQLYIHLKPKGVTQSYGLNFDDIALTESTGGGQRITLEESSGPYRWPELPANFEHPSANQAVYTHFATTVRTGNRVRNYTYCYDTQHHNPVWVAYLLHSIYQEGGYTRPAVDPWAPDPSLDAAVQSKIYPTDENDKFTFYTNTTLDGGMWTRGHLVMSSERGCGDKQNPALLNRQTFYPTNVAPQPSGNDYTFGTVWGYVESLFSGTRNIGETEFPADDGQVNLNQVADTLFMVAGCHYGNLSLVETDATYFSEFSSASKLCTMPTHQFKLALRTKKGNTGKRIQECDANELQAIGFWIPTYMTDAVTSGRIDRFAKPVAEIERLTNITFFPEVPAEVKASFDRSEWGF